MIDMHIIFITQACLGVAIYAVSLLEIFLQTFYNTLKTSNVFHRGGKGAIHVISLVFGVYWYGI